MKRFLTYIIPFTILGLFSSCSNKVLTAYTDFVTHEEFASFYVGTPDPILENPPFGQRLKISWNIPKQRKNLYPLQLQATLRFKNHQEETIAFPIKKSCGTYVYYLLNENYLSSGGLQTYKIQITNCEGVIYQFCHQLWSEIILFEDAPDEDNF